MLFQPRYEFQHDFELVEEISFYCNKNTSFGFLKSSYQTIVIEA
jgi:hypothetical protein